MAALMAEGGGEGQSRGHRWAWAPVAVVALMLAGCVPPARGPAIAPPPPRNAPPPALRPSEPGPGLPQDVQRNRVAVLVPLTGANAAVGRSIADAANMAILDTGGAKVRITIYDTAPGAAVAARHALADGNRLILGPLLGADVAAVAPIARAAGVPVVSFSNDESQAGNGVDVMGFTPEQSIVRIVGYAKSRGLTRLAVLVPAGVYGRRASSALTAAVGQAGVTITTMQSFDRSPPSLAAAIARLGPRGSYDGVLIADNGVMAERAAPLIRKAAGPGVRILGTELWATDAELDRVPALAGAWYASVANRMFEQLSGKYRAQFGRAPMRIASLGYDAVLLTVRIAGQWRPGTPFPARALTDRGGFTGVDGAFRFDRDGVAERALQVTQIGPDGETVISPAPSTFGD